MDQQVLSHLTGNLNPDRQAEWLDAHGWKYELNSSGEILLYNLEAARKMAKQKGRLAKEMKERGNRAGLRVIGYKERPSRTFVYIVGAVGLDEPIKVGYSVDVEKRLAALQSGSPVKLEIRAHYAAEDTEYARSIERRIHDYLKDKRSHGEWFKVKAAEVIEWIDSTFASNLNSRKAP